MTTCQWCTHKAKVIEGLEKRVTHLEERNLILSGTNAELGRKLAECQKASSTLGHPPFQ